MILGLWHGVRFGAFSDTTVSGFKDQCCKVIRQITSCSLVSLNGDSDGFGCRKTR